ncbi:MAG: TonB family protein [Terracidiphilus sp.]
MNGILEIGEHLERELAPEPLAGPAAGSVGLHLAIAGLLIYYGWVLGLFHHNVWGGPGAGGAMQVNLVSSALPLPADQINQNVLATETPSQAPAPPSPKEQKRMDETAIPILGKQVKPKQQNIARTQPHQPLPKPYVAPYGEQAGSSMPHQMQAGSTGPVSVANGDFGSRFPWYVEIIKRKVAQNWYRSEVDPRTPSGTMAEIYFRIDRQGVPSDFSIKTASGNPTLDRSCLEATERVDTFGPLPPQSDDRWLDVTYDCTY